MKYLFANWKKNLSVEESVAFAKTAGDFSISPEVTLALFPDGDAFSAVKDVVHAPVQLGTQDVDEAHGLEGAYVIVGHSSRRAGETQEMVAEKMKKAVAASVIPVLCVSRIEEVKSAFGDTQPQEVFVAYEPLEAIGTGNNAPPAEVAEKAQSIATILEKFFPDTIYHILYGGSVNAENVADYINLPHVEGVLVGKASASRDSLSALLAAMN